VRVKISAPGRIAAVCAGSESSANPDGPAPICEYVGGVPTESEGDERFLLADDNVHVPAAMIDIIVDAFSTTPGRGTAEEEIVLALAEPFSVDELRRLIKKKSNTAPGLSALTYQMLSLLPEEASRDMSRLMEKMWNAKHVPDFWKLKGLIWLPKVEVVTGVIETTRKVWTTMVTRRILGVVRRRLQLNHCGGLANKGTDTALLQLINLLEDLQEVKGAADHVTSDTPLDFMSSDTAKAFDSVGNTGGVSTHGGPCGHCHLAAGSRFGRFFCSPSSPCT
jgi:hypothetical protein